MTMGHTELLDAWQPTVIKGNAAEIGALADLNEVRRHGNQPQLRTCTLKTDSCFPLKVKAQGVDSLGGFKNTSEVVRSLARTHRS
jgi:thiamine-phosphate diphosphorylase / hydroxyethylthiazole kinase